MRQREKKQRKINIQKTVKSGKDGTEILNNVTNTKMLGRMKFGFSTETIL